MKMQVSSFLRRQLRFLVQQNIELLDEPPSLNSMNHHHHPTDPWNV